jgi:hypothetical protein
MKIIQIRDKNYVECEWKLLPTDSKSYLAKVETALNNFSMIHRDHKYVDPFHLEHRVAPQYLYILIDEEIKVGDYYYAGGKSDPYSIHKCDSERLAKICKEMKAQKISSTNNFKLIRAGVPKLPEAFIDDFTGLSNQGKLKEIVYLELDDTLSNIKIMGNEVFVMFCKDQWIDIERAYYDFKMAAVESGLNINDVLPYDGWLRVYYDAPIKKEV